MASGLVLYGSVVVIVATVTGESLGNSGLAVVGGIRILPDRVEAAW